MSIAMQRDERLATKLQGLRASLAQGIRGNSEVIDLLIIAVISGGSVLIEGPPGVGKTTLAKSLAALLSLEFQRVQCTPDLLPADIIGFSVFNPRDSSFTLRPGPIFTNVLLVDEINRASPRTQAALLEAMAEGQATIEGVQRRIEAPFVVLATQNPIGSKGTFPLPEAQLDRFLFQLVMGYPAPSEELELLLGGNQHHPSELLEGTISEAELLQMQAEVKEVHVERAIGEFALKIIQQTREDKRLRVGCSPRAALMLIRTAQGAAYLAGRSYVLPDDVLRVAVWALHHRILINRHAEQTTVTQLSIMRDIIHGISVPV